MRRLPRRARETVTLETPQRLAIVSRVGFTIEWEHKLIFSTSLLVKQRLVLRRVLLGGGGPYFAPGPDEVGGGASKGYRGAGKTPRCRYLAKARLALLRSGPRRVRGWSFEGLVYRLELDAEWVGEE